MKNPLVQPSTRPLDEEAPDDASSVDDSFSTGLTDDQRVSREDDSAEDAARVKLGPADLERLEKP